MAEQLISLANSANRHRGLLSKVKTTLNLRFTSNTLSFNVSLNEELVTPVSWASHRECVIYI